MHSNLCSSVLKLAINIKVY